MNMFDFMSGSPFLTAFIIYAIGHTAIEVAYRFTNKCNCKEQEQ